MSQEVIVVVEHLQGEIADISYVMTAAARALASGTGGDVVAIVLGHGAQGLATELAADRVLCVDDARLAEFTPDAYVEVIASVAKERSPRAILLGDTSIGADVAGRLSVRLGWPLVSRCQSILPGGAGFASHICGGKIVAEGDIPVPHALITLIPGGYKADQGRSAVAPAVVDMACPPLPDLRVTLVRYVQPEAGDVDITRERVLVAVGRGIQQEANLELAEELAELLGGAVCASRPVVDQGWLPTSRLVGKSGKRVSPKLYLALGISGAPEHLEGMSDSETVVAVNMDPAAPIFGIARFGTTADMFDLLPVLSERIRSARGA